MAYIEWLRNRVGQRKIFLVFGTVVLRDEYGRILLQKRTDFSFWGLPGGVMEWGEDIETCTRRELLEETGLTAGPLHLVGVYTHPKYDVTYPNGDQVQQFTICLTGQVNGGTMQPDGEETTEQAFFAPEAVAQMNLPIWYADMVRDTLVGAWPVYTRPFSALQTEDQIGVVRPFIGQEPLIAVGAMALVVGADGRILTIQRQDNKVWTLPAGFADLGENVAQTAVRETFEETGYQIELERLIGVYSGADFQHTYPNGDQVQNVGAMFKARLVGGQPNPDLGEVAGLRWQTPEQFLAVLPANTWRSYFKLVLQHLDAGSFVC
ncbi:MAG: NUDIX domain-containing protein [Ardenticatenaceae bacterium]|nr:NUDIX domain-containing protein [Anaerolineales bacterium]MCB8941640.1 NUDIX domain-containing protein [Ardenticatenaceae bacterium]MCB8974465.1 NUDIX domain-containing protein [Ardenticatenaceae bacterium]